MAGTPTEAEIQDQWKKVVNVLEKFRAHVDGTHAGAAGLWDTLEQSLEGEYTPAELSAFVNNFRAGCASLMTPAMAQQALTPILFEYGLRIDSDASGTQGFGTGYRSADAIFRALYDWFVIKSYTVESRDITFDTSATTGNGAGAIVGSGSIGRLTVDENGFDLEACTVEKKRFKCIVDQNTGQNENQEIFEVLGEAAGFDSVNRAAFGSGDSANTTLVSKHAGQGAGGSLLSNSSFSDFTSGATPEFSGWTETAAPAGSLDQDLVNFYRTHPGAQTDASLELTGGLGTITLKQTLSSMRIRRLDQDTPYALRVMLNPAVGVAAAGGNVALRCGTNHADIDVSAMSAGWQELVLTFNGNLWPRAFNEDPFDVEISWTGSTSGTLLIDDVIFAPMDLVDGTYWFIRGNHATHTPWLLDDMLAFTDTGGLPATGKIQWWLMVAGFGYLPSSGSPTLADPT
jgi:hypothetical protein